MFVRSGAAASRRPPRSCCQSSRLRHISRIPLPHLGRRRRPSRPREPGRGGPGGRGGGRGNPCVALYTERCAACHGTDTAAGRAPNLFDDQWVRAKDDEGIARVIADGVPQTEMIPFKDAADRSADLAARRLPASTQGANAQAAPDLRGRRRRTGDQDREADVQDRGGRAGHRDAVGARVPARRPPARDRARRQAAHHSEGQVGHRRDRDRHAQALGAPGRRLSRRRGASAVREERLDLPGVFRARPELHAAASAAGGRGAAGARGTRRERPADAQHPVDDHDRARQDQREERVDRPAGALPRAARSVHRPTTRTTARASPSIGRATSSTRSASAA